MENCDDCQYTLSLKFLAPLAWKSVFIVTVWLDYRRRRIAGITSRTFSEIEARATRGKWPGVFASALARLPRSGSVLAEGRKGRPGQLSINTLNTSELEQPDDDSLLFRRKTRLAGRPCSISSSSGRCRTVILSARAAPTALLLKQQLQTNLPHPHS